MSDEKFTLKELEGEVIELDLIGCPAIPISGTISGRIDIIYHADCARAWIGNFNVPAETVVTLGNRSNWFKLFTRDMMATAE